MTYLSTPLIATGWEKTLVNDSEGNTILLMPNAHKGLDAVKEATALFAAAPEMLAALELMNELFADHAQYDDEGHETAAIVAMQAAISKAKGEA
jgi:hypothetical protein